MNDLTKLLFALVLMSVSAVAAPVDPPRIQFVPKTQVEKAAMAVVSRYSEKELREIMGFFAPVVKKWTPIGEKFAAEYVAAKDKDAILAGYLPRARMVIEDARRMKLPPKYENRRAQYVLAAEAVCSVVSMYLKLGGKLK